MSIPVEYPVVLENIIMSKVLHVLNIVHTSNINYPAFYESLNNFLTGTEHVGK